MKKSLKKDAERPRRLILSRETIKILEDARLLQVAGGEGAESTTITDITTSGTSGQEISTQAC